jgi:hypothetical protein
VTAGDYILARQIERSCSFTISFFDCMHIAIIDKGGVNVLAQERAIAIGNITNWYLAEGIRKAEPKTLVRSALENMLSEKPNYATIGSGLEFPGDLTTMYLPFIILQEHMNHSA